MVAPVTLGPGTVFAGDYRIERPLAEGGMGAVYVVQQISTGKRRALKVMHPTLVPDAKSRARFVEEARVGARIESDHVVDVLAAGVDSTSGIPWLVMELLEGSDLDQVVAQRGALPPAEVVDLMQQIAHALGAAHRLGIIHRDLKPENLFLARSRRRNEALVPKILDFGIARMVEGNATAATVTSAIGSPLWMAPEQAQPGAKLRPSTDVWALGLITFFLMTARNYWNAANHEQFNLSALLVEVMTHPIVPPSARAAELGASLPASFDAWFLRCVDRDPMARFPDATQAVDALALALESAPAPSAAFASDPGLAHAPTGVAPAMATPAPFATPQGQPAPTAPMSAMATPAPGVHSPAPHPAASHPAALQPMPHAVPTWSATAEAPNPTPWGLIIAAVLGVCALLGVGLIGGAYALLGSDDAPETVAVSEASVTPAPEPAAPLAPPPPPVVAAPEPPPVPQPAPTPPAADGDSDLETLDQLTLGRRVEQHRSAGRQAQAVTAMQVYVRRFPNEPRARQYRNILDRMGAPSGARPGAAAPSRRVAGGAEARRPPAGPPRVRTGNVEVRGSLSREVIRRVMRRHQNQIQFCYQTELQRNPRLEGRVVVSFVIGSTGAVQTATISNSTLNDAAVEGCMIRQIRRVRFPSPQGGGIVVVNFPFVMSSG